MACLRAVCSPVARAAPAAPRAQMRAPNALARATVARRGALSMSRVGACQEEKGLGGGDALGRKVG